VTVQQQLRLNSKKLQPGSIQCLKNPFHDRSASMIDHQWAQVFDVISVFGDFCDVEIVGVVSQLSA
jgi:hypothetical protein